MSSQDASGATPNTALGSATGRHSHLAADGEPEPCVVLGDELDLVPGKYRIPIFHFDPSKLADIETVLDGGESDGVVDVAEGVEVGLPQRPRAAGRPFRRRLVPEP